jgi:ubiquitin-protein ligase
VEDVPVFDIEDHAVVTFWSRDFVVRAPGHDVASSAAADFSHFDVVLQEGIAGRVGEVLCTDLVTGRIAVRWLDGCLALEDPFGLLKLDEDDFESVQVRVSRPGVAPPGTSGDSDSEGGHSEEGSATESEGGGSADNASSSSQLASEASGDYESVGDDSDLMTLDSAAENMMYSATSQYSASLAEYAATLQRLRGGATSGPQLQAPAPRITPSMLRDAYRMLAGAAKRGGTDAYMPVAATASDTAIMHHWAGVLLGTGVPSPVEDDTDEQEEDGGSSHDDMRRYAPAAALVLPEGPSPVGMGAVVAPVAESIMSVWRRVAAAAGLLPSTVGSGGVFLSVPHVAPSDFMVRSSEEGSASVPLSEAVKRMPKPNRKWMQALRTNVAQLKRGLPPGVAAVSFEGSSMACRLVVMGPPGTPFAYVPWVFDAFMGGGFPQEAPQLHFHSYVSQKVGPNLYPDGKVCLSLLGTWHAEAEGEGWDGATSTLLQVAVSLQGIILTELPFFMEAGYSKHAKTAAGQHKARQYNEMAVVLALRSLAGMVQRPPSGLEALICTHAQQVLPRLQAVYAPFVGPEPAAAGATSAAVPPASAAGVPAPPAAAAGGGDAAPSMQSGSGGVLMHGIDAEVQYMRSLLPAEPSAAFRRGLQVALRGLADAVSSTR